MLKDKSYVKIQTDSGWNYLVHSGYDKYCIGNEPPQVLHNVVLSESEFLSLSKVEINTIHVAYKCKSTGQVVSITEFADYVAKRRSGDDWVSLEAEFEARSYMSNHERMTETVTSVSPVNLSFVGYIKETVHPLIHCSVSFSESTEAFFYIQPPKAAKDFTHIAAEKIKAQGFDVEFSSAGLEYTKVAGHYMTSNGFKDPTQKIAYFKTEEAALVELDKIEKNVKMSMALCLDRARAVQSIKYAGDLLSDIYALNNKKSFSEWKNGLSIIEHKIRSGIYVGITNDIDL